MFLGMLPKSHIMLHGSEVKFAMDAQEVKREHPREVSGLYHPSFHYDTF